MSIMTARHVEFAFYLIVHNATYNKIQNPKLKECKKDKGIEDNGQIDSKRNLQGHI